MLGLICVDYVLGKSLPAHCTTDLVANNFNIANKHLYRCYFEFYFLLRFWF